VTFELPAEAWALLERALEGARRKAATPLTDADALAAVARDALASQNQAADASDPRCSVVVYECRSCAKSELDTGVSSLELEPATAATLACGAREVDLASEGRTVQRGGPLPAAIRRAVLVRDRCRCRVPGCNRRRYVDVHHLVPRSEDGEHSRRNCISLCSTHHRRLHEGKLLITGDADAEPLFQDAAKQTVAAFGEDGGPRRRAGGHASDGEWAEQQPSPPARREKHSLNDDNASAQQRRGEGHVSGADVSELAGPERQHNGANALAPAGPEKHSLNGDNASSAAGDNRDHLGFAASMRPIVEGPERRVGLAGRQRCHVPHSSYRGAPLIPPPARWDRARVAAGVRAAVISPGSRS
jgi:hypothetical protein